MIFNINDILTKTSNRASCSTGMGNLGKYILPFKMLLQTK